MFRIGQARDIHRLEQGRKLILGGIEIPFDKGLKGHSDADVLIHAIVNAIIGALGLGDIGKFFPDNDQKYKDISSEYFLKEVKLLLLKEGYQINNIDCTVIIEKPILRPYIDDMRDNISKILDIKMDKINIKATRGEKLGYVGESLGAEAECVVLLTKNN